MSSLYALIQDKRIANIIYLDDDSDLVTELGAVKIPIDMQVQLGSEYINGAFVEIVESNDDIDTALPELSYADIEQIIAKIIHENTSK